MLDGKTAFVTGGSGAVGSAIVRVLAREGCKVAFSFHSHGDQAGALQDECRANGRDVRAYALDILDAKACQALARTVEQDMGRVDVLVNNAGVTQVMPFAMIEEKDWDMVMDVNVKGMFLVTKAFARGMIRRKSGNIINMGSLAGMRVLEVPVHYAAAKSAVVGFTLSLARELGRYNIRVNAVVPGMLTGGVSTNVPPKQQEKYKEFCCLSRAGKPEEVAELVAFLAGDRSSYINAQSLFVDGGDLMKFRMVDRILDWHPRRCIAGVKAVSFEEYSLRSPWGSGAALPESLLMESLFQLGNWLIVLTSDFRQMGLLVRIEEVEFHEPLGPGQSLRMDIEVVSYRDDGVVFNGVATSAGRQIASGRGCLATPVDLADFHNPDDLKVLFSEIHRPLAEGLA